MKTGFAYNFIQEVFSRAYGLATGNDPYPLRTLLEQQYQSRAPKRILDVGCGSGGYALNGEDYTGIDPNPHYVEYCRKNRPGRFLQMSGNRMEFAEKTFDTVICFSVGHHLPNAVFATTLSEISRVLVDDGILYFADIIRPITRSKLASKVLERLDEGNAFRTEDEYKKSISRWFRLCERRELVDQFYRTIFFTFRKADLPAPPANPR